MSRGGFQPSGGSSGGAPTGTAGGDLGGTYPNPTVPGLAGLVPNPSTAVRWVDGLYGSDSNTGLIPGSPKLTLGSAYSALPSTGGVLMLNPGRYDTDTLTMLRQKPVSIFGIVPPERYVVSTTTVPLSATTYHAAILYSSSGAASLFTTTGGTASKQVHGLTFRWLLFELSAAATKVALDIDTCSNGFVQDCVFFADKTTGPAAVDAIGVKVRSSAPGVYGGDDASWWRIENCRVINMALCEMGNATGTKYSANQHVIRDNHALGLAHANTSTKPMIGIYGGHRCVVRDNNVEAYNIGIKWDSCWDCLEEGDGGEFVDVFCDLYNTKGCDLTPLGIAYAQLGDNAATTPILTGALLVRGDASTKANIIHVPGAWTAGNTQRLANPTNDASHPYLSIDADNIVQSPRNSVDQAFATTAQLNAITSVSIASLAADATAITATTTLTSIGLSFPVSASATEIWFFDAFLLVSAGNATMDVKVGLSGPSGATAAWGNGDIAGSSANPGFYSLASTSSPSQALGIGGIVTLGTVSGQQLIHMSGWVFGGGTSGNLNVQLAQNTSDAGNLIAKKGSHIKYYKVAA